MKCHRCGYEYDDACGRYGCPNCHGEGLETLKLPPGLRFTDPETEFRLRLRQFVVRHRMHRDPFKHALNTRWRAYFHHKRAEPCAVLPFPSP